MKPPPSNSWMSDGLMSGRSYALVSDGAGEPQMNMGLDLLLFGMVEKGQLEGALRIYQWACPCVSVGRNQDVLRTLNTVRCAELGVPVVRRPTGGRGVIHGRDLTLSITVRLSSLPPDCRSVCGSHSLFASAMGDALRQLGLETFQGSDSARVPATTGDCFATATKADLTYADGVKAIGGAQARRRNALLEQVSIPCGAPQLAPEDVFCGFAASYTQRCLRDLAGSRLRACLAGALSQALGCRWTPRTWTLAELATARELGEGCAVDTSLPL